MFSFHEGPLVHPNNDRNLYGHSPLQNPQWAGDPSYPSPLSPDMLLPDPFPDSGPPQRQFHQSAYMQDHQALLECCRALELREIQLTTERDTIRSMFECLAGAVQLSKSDPFQLNDSNVIGPTSHGSSRPTHQQYPKIRFWSQDNFIEWLDTASSQTTDCGKIPYLEDENGDPVPEKTVKAIRKLLLGWMATASARQLIHTLVENAYPLFKFADDGWKLDYLATTSYPSWRRNNFDGDNRKSRDSIKKEDDDADNDDNDDNDDNTSSNEQTGKKRKRSTASESIEPQVSSKKNKVVPTSLTPPLSAPAALPVPVIDVPRPLTSLTVDRAGSESGNAPSSPDLGISCPKSKPGLANTKNATEPIESTTEPPVDSESTTKPLADSESTTEPLTDSKNTIEPVTDSDETATNISNASSKPRPVHTPKPLRITLPNPLSVLALAAAKVIIPPSPPAELDPSPPLQSHGPGDPPLEDGAGLKVKKEKVIKTSGKSKMRPSPKQNGRNLCAHRWLKQIKTNGTTDEFCVYYSNLDEEQRKEYDNEANTLATEKKWNKTINTGKIY
ncbi:hypothetical protein EDB19DRAFT_1827296 [Suillus lakei]|nr:hypothetical protein EDB19DRAFT_1827296 [Suillus lakei]